MGVDRHGTGVVECIRATDFPSGKPYGAVAFLVGIHRESIFSLFYLSRSFIRRGGEGMYITIEVLFAFCALIVDLLALVILIFQNNKKK
jgi:hypothetical protein